MCSASPADSAPCKLQIGEGETTQNAKTESVKRRKRSSGVRVIGSAVGMGGGEQMTTARLPSLVSPFCCALAHARARVS